jgi:hypothetical protein
VWWRNRQIGDNQRSITDRQGSLFFVVMSLSMGPMMGCLVVFQAERVIFIREHSTGCYSTLAYYLTKVVAEIPALLVVPVVQGTISYWMVGYQSAADRYFIFIAACIAVTLVAHALGLSISVGTAPNLVPYRPSSSSAHASRRLLPERRFHSQVAYVVRSRYR